MAKKILILNGPNLNFLGKREPEVYGNLTLSDIEQMCAEEAATHSFEIDFRQSNSEGELVTWIQDAGGEFAGIVFNPAAYSHTSIAIRDALPLFEGPIVEVHISNIHARERFRHHSHVSPVATGVICGLGTMGYKLAIAALADQL